MDGVEEQNEESSESMSGENRRLFRYLDDIEKRVEEFRTHALAVTTEKDELLRDLHDLQVNKEVELNDMNVGDKEELLSNADRLIYRCLAVDIAITTPRTPTQEIALEKVNARLIELRKQIDANIPFSEETMKKYYNSCLPDPVDVIDCKFQNLILECTVDDQKTIKQTLGTWQAEHNGPEECILEEVF